MLRKREKEALNLKKRMDDMKAQIDDLNHSRNVTIRWDFCKLTHNASSDKFATAFWIRLLLRCSSDFYIFSSIKVGIV